MNLPTRAQAASDRSIPTPALRVLASALAVALLAACTPPARPPARAEETPESSRTPPAIVIGTRPTAAAEEHDAEREVPAPPAAVLRLREAPWADEAARAAWSRRLDAAAAADPATPNVPHPMWTLRDGRGRVVQAVTAPVLSVGKPWESPRLGEPGERPMYACMAVTWYEGRRVGGVSYALDTGRPHDCYPRYADWEEARGAVYHLDPACRDRPLGVPASALGLTVLHVGDTLYYLHGAPAAVRPSTLYKLANNGRCEALRNASQLTLWAFEPLPASLAAPLPAPPYSLDIEMR